MDIARTKTWEIFLYFSLTLLYNVEKSENNVQIICLIFFVMEAKCLLVKES